MSLRETKMEKQPMLCLEDTKIEFKSQGFKAKQIGVSPSELIPKVNSTVEVRCGI